MVTIVLLSMGVMSTLLILKISIRPMKQPLPGGIETEQNETINEPTFRIAPGGSVAVPICDGADKLP